MGGIDGPTRGKRIKDCDSQHGACADAQRRNDKTDKRIRKLERARGEAITTRP